MDQEILKETMPKESVILAFRETVDVRYGNLGVLSTGCVFLFVNRLLVYLGTPKSVAITESWKWRNLTISWMHSLISAAWVLTCICLFPELLEDLIANGNYYMYGLVAFSTGYFIYDFIDIIVNNMVFQWWEVSVHHTICVLLMLYSLQFGINMAFICLTLSIEINSVFLHTRKLMQMLRVDYSHWIYRLTSVANMLTFVVFRGLSLSTMWCGTLVWYKGFPVLFHIILCVGMVPFSALNVMMFWRLLKNDFLRKTNKSSQIANRGNACTNSTNNNTSVELKEF